MDWKQKYIRLLEKLTQRSAWQKIILWILVVWICFFVFAFIATVLFWSLSDDPQSLEIASGVFMTISFLLLLMTAIPGFIVLTHQNVRQKLYTIPELAASSVFAVSLLLGVLSLIVLQINGWGFDLSSDQQAPLNLIDDILGPIFSGLLIGVLAFALTFGLFFPFGIPLVCTFATWMIIEENQHISPRTWSIFLIVSTLGWMLTAIFGYALGMSG